MSPICQLQMHGTSPSDSELEGIIGGPLLKTYIERFGYSEQDACTAVKIYREHYASEGIKGAEFYPGILELLNSLKNTGYVTAVATLKTDHLAKTILSKLDVAEYFDIICGMNEKDTLAWRRGFITTEQLRTLGEELKMTDYGKYLISLSEGNR